MAAVNIFFSKPFTHAYFSEKCVEQTPMFNKVFYLKINICEESKLKKASFRHRTNRGIWTRPYWRSFFLSTSWGIVR